MELVCHLLFRRNKFKEFVVDEGKKSIVAMTIETNCLPLYRFNFNSIQVYLS